MYSTNLKKLKIILLFHLVVFTSLVLVIRLAYKERIHNRKTLLWLTILTVSPNKQYWIFVFPTIPPTAVPEWKPIYRKYFLVEIFRLSYQIWFWKIVWSLDWWSVDLRLKDQALKRQWFRSDEVQTNSRHFFFLLLLLPVRHQNHLPKMAIFIYKKTTN